MSKNWKEPIEVSDTNKFGLSNFMNTGPVGLYCSGHLRAAETGKPID